MAVPDFTPLEGAVEDPPNSERLVQLRESAARSGIRIRTRNTVVRDQPRVQLNVGDLEAYLETKHIAFEESRNRLRELKSDFQEQQSNVMSLRLIISGLKITDRVFDQSTSTDVQSRLSTLCNRGAQLLLKVPTDVWGHDRDGFLKFEPPIVWPFFVALESQNVIETKTDILIPDFVGSSITAIDCLIAKLLTNEVSNQRIFDTVRNPLGDSVPWKQESDDVNTGEHASTAKMTTKPRKNKRSTEKGEAIAKLIAALTEHHQYAKDSCLSLEPIGSNALAKKAGVARSTASVFFTDQFKGHSKYRSSCLNKSTLTASLKLLNGDFAPYLLYGKVPSKEGDRDNDE